MEGLLLAAAACVVLVCIRGFLGWLLRPVFGGQMLTLCFVEGEEETLEHRVRAFGWYRDGRSSGGELVLVDCGLTEAGLCRAQQIMKQYLWLSYCPAASLQDYLEVYEAARQKKEISENVI